MADVKNVANIIFENWWVHPVYERAHCLGGNETDKVYMYNSQNTPNRFQNHVKSISH